MDTSKISESLGRIDRKSASLSSIADELALLGVDYISPQVLAGCLRDAGWTYKTTGRVRLWIAPGLTAESAGVSLPVNVRYRVSVFISQVLELREQIYVGELQWMVQKEFGDRLKLTIVNNQMELRIARGEWILIKSREGKGNYWKRKTPLATSNDKPI